MTVIEIILIVVLVILAVSYLFDGIMTRREVRAWIRTGTYLNETDVRDLHLSTRRLSDLVAQVRDVQRITCPVCKSEFYAHPKLPRQEES